MSQENNFIPNQEDYKPLTPFGLFVKSNFPFIENTFEALDNYGLYCKIVEYLNNVIANEQVVTQNTQALYNAFVSLNTYVSNYFDNLDVQDEINNKLDEMVTTGELQELLKEQYDDLKSFTTERLNQIDAKVDGAVSGTPAGVYSTVSDLTTADPNHSKIYVVTATGYWYYYANNQWNSGGPYQSSVDSAEVSDLSYIINNSLYLDFGFNLLNINNPNNVSGFLYNGNVSENAGYTTSDFIYLYDNSQTYITYHTDRGDNKFVSFYDENKTYISNSWAQTTDEDWDLEIPIGAKYIRVSCLNAAFDNTQINRYHSQINYGDTYTTYYPYHAPVGKLRGMSKYIFVSKDATYADFASITEAVKFANDNDIIYIGKGTYENEIIEAWGKNNLSLIGEDRQNTIIRNSTDNYDTPPLEIASGYVANLTFETINNNSAVKKAYCVHVENDSMINRNLTFFNCSFKPVNNAGIGMGMRPGCNVLIENCSFERNTQNGGYSLFIHDSADYSGIQNIKIHNCQISTVFANAMRIDDQCVEGTTVNIEFINTIIKNIQYTTTNPIWFNNTSGETGQGLGGLNNYVLSELSYNNNYSLLNKNIIT